MCFPFLQNRSIAEERFKPPPFFRHFRGIPLTEIGFFGYSQVMISRRSAAGLALGGLFLFIAGAVWLSDVVIGGHFRQLEEKAILEDVQQLHEALNNQLNAMERSVRDYAHWEDAWVYVHDHNREFETVNFSQGTFTNLDVEAFLYIDTLGHPFRFIGWKLGGTEQDTLSYPKDLLKPFPITHAVYQQAKSLGGSHWIQKVDSTYWLVALAGVTPNANSKQVGAWMLMLRRLDTSKIQVLQNQLHTKLQLINLIDSNSPPTLTKSIDSTILKSQIMIWSPSQSSQKESIGILQIGDFNSVFIKIQRHREIELSGSRALQFLWISLLVLGSLLLLSIIIILRKHIILPLVDLSTRFHKIAQTGDLSVRMEVQGPREIRNHAIALNTMLNTLEQTVNQLEASEQEQRLLASALRDTHSYMVKLVDFLPDATFAVDAKGNVVAWNKAMAQLCSKDALQMNGLPLDKVAELLYGARHSLLLERFFPDKYKNYAESMPGVHQLSNGMIAYEEFIAHLDDQKGRYLEQTACPMRDSQGNFLGAVQTFRDVTEHKKAEMRLQFLSLHDTLTGLYNRTWFAEISKSMGSQERLPLAIVLVDLDGLKLVNDTLGHEHGDAFILAASSLLRNAFVDQKIGRIGGDEFVILFTNTTEDRVQDGISLLRQNMKDYNEGNPPMPVQMSVGWAWSDEETDISLLVKEADANMYRDKDLRRDAVKALYITTLQNRFEEIHKKDQNISRRLEDLSRRFAMHLEVDKQSLEHLRLLARYRDLGKVGLSNRVLLKPGALSEEETDELKKQPEIGYRIARVSRDLAPIADLILKHREWWDGRGYPLGLSGEHIPYLNRILQVVEAYVVMTGPRIRTVSKGKEDALEDIRAMSGKKLDPALVEGFIEFIHIIHE